MKRKYKPQKRVVDLCASTVHIVAQHYQKRASGWSGITACAKRFVLLQRADAADAGKDWVMYTTHKTATCLMCIRYAS